MASKKEATAVPPEIGSVFGEELDSGGLDGYYTHKHLVTEVMCWLLLTESDAEDYIEEQGPEQAIEAVQTQIRA